MSDHVATGTRSRTRLAIIDAAIGALARNQGASLGEIATAAGVGRSTLHRYFPERSDLLAAVSAVGLSRVEEARARARLADGTGASAMRRLCQEYFDLGDLLTLIFSDPQLTSDPSWNESIGCDDELAGVVERGHRDGTIDPQLPPNWVQSLLWSMLYAGWAQSNEPGVSKHDILPLLIRSFEGAVGAKQA